MIDVNTTQFCRSLSETVEWCAGQSLFTHPEEPPDIKRRRALIEKAGELFQRSYCSGKWNLFYRLICKNRDRRRAMKMRKEADPDSLALLKEQLRTPALRPPFALGESRTEAERYEMVAEVIKKRAALLRSRQTNLPEAKSVEPAGRLLLYFPNENLADGAAQYSSNGFFDVDNVPPWDLWVHYSDSTLVSWVPPELVTLAQSGIDVNLEACIRWAD
ncbi:MAG TPA: hypothetical protein VFA71_02285 [Terriglobales bacterium]|nr:hypothetical protein [Terriglobales bacterium]